MSELIINDKNIWNDWQKAYNECLQKTKRICGLEPKFDGNKCVSALCVINHAMQDIRTYFNSKEKSISNLCFLIRNIDVSITSIIDLNNILLNVGKNKADKAIEKSFRNSECIKNFRTLRSLILAHPVDTNYVNNEGNIETVYLEDVLYGNLIVFEFLIKEKSDYVLKLCIPNEKDPYFKPLNLNETIIPAIKEIINGILQLSDNITKFISQAEEELIRIPLKIKMNTINGYITSLNKELLIRYPEYVWNSEYEQNDSIVLDCINYFNAHFSHDTQNKYNIFLDYIKKELKRIENDLQNMKYDEESQDYFSLCYNSKFASNESYAIEKVVSYLKNSKQKSFTLDEVSKNTTSNTLWGIQQFKKLIPYINEYIPVDVSVSNDELYREFVAANYLSNLNEIKGENE